MNILRRCFKGLLYKNEFAYRLISRVKFLPHYSLRFKLAAQHIHPGDSVLELCSAFGEFKKYLPEDCHYTCIEASPEFSEKLNKKGIVNTKQNLHQGLSAYNLKADVLVMIVSLCQFKNTSLDDLLESFKTAAKKVIIIECVAKHKRSPNSLTHKIINYISATDYYHSTELFTHDEFEKVLSKHQYSYKRYNDIYAIGSYTS